MITMMAHGDAGLGGGGTLPDRMPGGFDEVSPIKNAIDKNVHIHELAAASSSIKKNQNK